MERKSKRQGQISQEEQRGQPGVDRDVSTITVVEAIHEIAKYNANASLDNEKQLTLFLQSWWSKTYNRPLKDPVLLSYTLEELLYEFYDKIERDRAITEGLELETDKIEEAKAKGNLDWAEEEEKRELEELRQKQHEETIAKQVEESAMGNPAEDPDNKAWMDKVVQNEIAQGKKLFGEDFGEDIEEDFNG